MIRVMKSYGELNFLFYYMIKIFIINSILNNNLIKNNSMMKIKKIIKKISSQLFT